jgi:hypothetical protein
MATSIGGFDIGFSSFPAAFGSIAMDGDEYVRCSRCGFGGCDVRVSGCGCTVHAVSVFAQAEKLRLEFLFVGVGTSGLYLYCVLFNVTMNICAWLFVCIFFVTSTERRSSPHSPWD